MQQDEINGHSELQVKETLRAMAISSFLKGYHFTGHRRLIQSLYTNIYYNIHHLHVNRYVTQKPAKVIILFSKISYLGVTGRPGYHSFKQM